MRRDDADRLVQPGIEGLAGRLDRPDAHGLELAENLPVGHAQAVDQRLARSALGVCKRQCALQVVEDDQHQPEHLAAGPLHRILPVPGRLLLEVFQVGRGVEEMLPVPLRGLPGLPDLSLQPFGREAGQVVLLPRPGFGRRSGPFSRGAAGRVLGLGVPAALRVFRCHRATSMNSMRRRAARPPTACRTA